MASDQGDLGAGVKESADLGPLVVRSDGEVHRDAGSADLILGVAWGRLLLRGATQLRGVGARSGGGHPGVIEEAVVGQGASAGRVTLEVPAFSSAVRANSLRARCTCVARATADPAELPISERGRGRLLTHGAVAGRWAVLSPVAHSTAAVARPSFQVVASRVGRVGRLLRLSLWEGPVGGVGRHPETARSEARGGL